MPVAKPPPQLKRHDGNRDNTDQHMHQQRRQPVLHVIKDVAEILPDPDKDTIVKRPSKALVKIWQKAVGKPGRNEPERQQRAEKAEKPEYPPAEFR